MTIQDYKNSIIKLNEFIEYASNQYYYQITFQDHSDKWCHGIIEPLKHIWHRVDSLCVCLVCRRTVEEKRKCV